jgi:hypothetical protein
MPNRSGVRQPTAEGKRRKTYTDGAEGILELIDEGNKPRVVDVDAMGQLSVLAT